MKKLLCLIIAAAMMLTLLASCGSNVSTGSGTAGSNVPGGSGTTGGGTVPGGNNGSWLASLSGTDMAKLLLANRRLDADVLSKEGDIFENGERVMYDLIDIAIANLGMQYAGEASAVPMSEENTTVETVEEEHGTTIKIGDKTVRWYGFPEMNNSYGAFLGMTNGIVSEAKMGAELIATVKKNIRVVNKWVSFFGTNYYLEVDENSETLYEYHTVDTLDIKIMKRYKNEAGKDVYEMYRRNTEYENRTLYIPGERYEFTDSYQYFVADKTKGYWEVYSMNEAPEHYNVSYFVIKDNICYDAFYDPETGEIPMLKVMSEDRKADIFNISKFYNGEDPAYNGIRVDLKFSGFNGIDYIETPRSDMESYKWDGENSAYITKNYENVSAHMLNGKVINYGDTYFGGKITVDSLMVSHFSFDGYHGEMGLRIYGATYEEQMKILKEFLKEVGFVCRRDIDGILTGIEIAYEELDGVIKYYSWNGINVTTEAGIAEAISKEKARMSALYAEYEAIKDKEVIEFTKEEDMEIHINFASIIDKSLGSAVIDGRNVTVPAVMLTINDTTLYVEEEPYTVAFALKTKNGSLVHLEFKNEATVKYAGEKEFTVSAENASFVIPDVASGEYTVVCYISTADGIRTSDYTELSFGEVKNLPVMLTSSELSAAIGAGGALTLTYTEKCDHNIELSSEQVLDFAAFKQLVGEEAFRYGTPRDELIEMLAGEEWVALTGEETEMGTGNYRIFYTAQNGETAVEGYVYINYIFQQPEQAEKQ